MYILLLGKEGGLGVRRLRIKLTVWELSSISNVGEPSSGDSNNDDIFGIVFNGSTVQLIKGIKRFRSTTIFRGKLNNLASRIRIRINHMTTCQKYLGTCRQAQIGTCIWEGRADRYLDCLAGRYLDTTQILCIWRPTLRWATAPLDEAGRD